MRMFKKILKWAGYTVLALLFVLLAIYGHSYQNTRSRFNKVYPTEVAMSPLPTDSGAYARGEHVFQIHGCASCHGEDLGGKIFLDDAVLGTVVAPNLTKGPGGRPADHNATDWWRSLKLGVSRSGKPLWVMPSHETAQMSDKDIADLIAYCTQQPPVASDLPKENHMAPIGRILMAFDMIPVLSAEKIVPSKVPVEHPREDDLAARGKYLTVSCQGCHREHMRGGAPVAPGFPEVRDISATGAAGRWTLEQFKHTLRTGNTPEGRQLKNEEMPWETTAQFTDDEIAAVYTYLRGMNTVVAQN